MNEYILAARPTSGNGKNQHRAKQQDSKTIETLAMLSNSLAHEFKNDLAAISICAELAEIQINNIKKRIATTDHLVNNLHLQIKSIIARKSNQKDFKSYSILKNIEEALEQYPFQDNERNLITVTMGQDFTYVGNPILTNHILCNLIKNSLRAISSANKGKITIKIKPGFDFNKITFKDTALGVSKDFMRKIFGLFESQNTAQGGTGAGLAFCKSTMQSYGGNITCESVYGKHTKFILKFPK